MDIAARVREFIIREFAIGMTPPELDADLDLVESGILDSLGLLIVIAWIEDLLGVEIDAGAVDTADFRSVGSICAMIESHRRADGSSGRFEPCTPVA